MVFQKSMFHITSQLQVPPRAFGIKFKLLDWHLFFFTIILFSYHWKSLGFKPDLWVQDGQPSQTCMCWTCMIFFFQPGTTKSGLMIPSGARISVKSPQSLLHTRATSQQLLPPAPPASDQDCHSGQGSQTVPHLTSHAQAPL